MNQVKPAGKVVMEMVEEYLEVVEALSAGLRLDA